MPRQRLYLTLDPSTHSLLTSTGNASRYVDQVVTERRQSWQTALSELQAAGWRAAEIKCACSILNGYWMLGGDSRGPQAIALELHDGQALNGTATYWEIEPARWAELVEAVAASWPLALAVSTVVREFWTGNTVCEQAIDRLG